MTTTRLVNQFRAWLLRPIVVHRLPGRLRLRVPAIKRLDAAQQHFAAAWRDLLTGPDGIEAVEVSPASGSVLIQYQTATLSEAEVLAYLNAVNRLVLRHWDRLAETPVDDLPRVLERLLDVVHGATRRRLTLEKELTIPDDVWT